MNISTFSWLDHDAEQARRSAELIRALSEPETVDSLGLGTVRDGFAGIFFPGTSTIQTRVRYALLVPWAMQLAAARNPRDRAHYDRLLRDLEARTIQALLEGNPTGELGIIGRNRGAATKRLASSVYWSALAEWGIRVAPELTMSAYRESVLSQRTRERVGDESGESAVYRVWDELPTTPEDFPEAPLSILPSAEEGDYLLSRMGSTSAGGLHVGSVANLGPSLLSVVARDPLLGDASAPWDLVESGGLTPYLRDCLHHAEAFSLVMQGARLRYVQLLFEAQRRAALPESEGAEALEALADRWREQMAAAAGRVATWAAELDHMYVLLNRAGIAVGKPTRDFIKAWVSSAVANPETAMRSSVTSALIRDREVALKSPNARLANESSLRGWDGAIFGERRLDYRWSVAQNMVNDCRLGIEANVAVA